MITHIVNTVLRLGRVFLDDEHWRTPLSPVRISAISFMEYATSGQRGRISIVSDQKAVYLADDFHGRGFYEPARDAMRSAANSPNPESIFDRAIENASKRGQAKAFTEIKNGYLAWLHKLKATGVQVNGTSWRSGDLELTVKPHLGLRLPDGSLFAVLVYLKELPLTQEAANVGLRILQLTMNATLPGATALVLDARRGKSFKMSQRTNLSKLDALIAAEAAGYVVHWHATA